MILGRDCRDIDECLETPGVCENGRCRNSAGSFQCLCAEGFTLTPTKDSCVDIDECWTNPGVCGNGSCINEHGGFNCQCEPGFQRGSRMECEDIDECRINYNLCRNGRCRNSLGSFSCECASGFRLTEDEGNCQVGNFRSSLFLHVLIHVPVRLCQQLFLTV